jgi:ketosteroid isomerase-like protein
VRLSALLALVSLMAAAPGAAQVLPGARSDGDGGRRQYRSESLREAQATLMELTQAWARDDARAAAALYTESAQLLLPGDSAPATGRGAVEQALARHLPGMGPLSFSLGDAEVGGDLLYMSGRYYFPETEKGAGTYLVVLQSRGRGWRIRTLFFAEDPAIASAEQDSVGG